MNDPVEDFWYAGYDAVIREKNEAAEQRLAGRVRMEGEPLPIAGPVRAAAAEDERKYAHAAVRIGRSSLVLQTSYAMDDSNSYIATEQLVLVCLNGQEMAMSAAEFRRLVRSFAEGAGWLGDGAG